VATDSAIQTFKLERWCWLDLLIFAYGASLGETKTASDILSEILEHSQRPEEKAEVLRLRSTNHFLKNDFANALNDILVALQTLGVEIDPSVDRRHADELLESVQDEILSRGSESILAMPTSENRRTQLIIKLLNDAGMRSYEYGRKHLYHRCRHRRLLEYCWRRLFGCHWLGGQFIPPPGAKF
jgi:hypothetical protein